MFVLLRFLILAFSIGAYSFQALAVEPLNAKIGLSTYRLGPGDTISVKVYGEDDLGVEAELTDAGTFVHPLLGEVKAVGKTIGELTAAMTKEVKNHYVVDPKISVNIVQYRKYYVNGEVKSPGAYPYEPGLTVYKAISVAGGFTQRASRTSISLISDNDPTHKEQEVELHTPIQPGDILTIDENFF